MMKKEWKSPRVLVQEFVPNEYVAACYKIKCTTPNNNSRYYYLYDDTNGNGTLDSEDELVYSNTGILGLGGGFTGCGRWHKGIIKDEAPAVNGFVTKAPYGSSGTRAEAVYWWSERLGSGINYHSMTPGQENYESNPNAS